MVDLPITCRWSIAVWGGYIHEYKYNEAVIDKVVLDLRYEARQVPQQITDQEKIDEFFERKTRGLTEYAKAQLKKKWGTMQALLSSADRMKRIAFDIIDDFEEKPRLVSRRGNAMLVASSIYEACQYYDVFQAQGFSKCAVITSYEPNALDTESREYAIYQKMLDKYRPLEKKSNESETDAFERIMKKRFVNQPGQLQLLIVVDKLLTGFDAPPATYLYVDKNMQDHGLFQAICRVNRLHGEDKDYGYIIDYRDLFKKLEKAVINYTSEAFSGFEQSDVLGKYLEKKLSMIKKIPEGYKQTEIGVIPEDWDVKKLGDIGCSVIGLTYSPSEVSCFGKLVHRSSNIQNNQLSYNDNVYVNKRINEKLILKENDILICVRNGSRDLIGKSALIKGKSVGETFGAFMSVFRSDKFQPFIFYLILSNLIQRQINQSLGATINQITNKTLNNFQIPFPPRPEEQSAIATVLSDTDALIENVEKLIAKKKAIKQGTMQQLLAGKKRLPGFSGEWETKLFGSLIEVNKGNQLNKSELTVTGEYPDWNGGIEPSGYTTKWNMFENTITISEGGNSCGFVNYCKQKFWCGGHCYVLKITNANLDKFFLYQLLKFKEKFIMSLRIGSGLPNIQKKNLNEFVLFIPKESQEQTAIATILSDMDSEIEKLEQKRDKYIMLKQGMMQQLLTGRIRIYANN